eukprot:3948913-Ditylum_brightwellii.AAC.1
MFQNVDACLSPSAPDRYIDVKEEQEEHMRRTMLEGEYAQFFQLPNLAMEEENENEKNALLEKDH